jgi:hypothetical protein
MDNQLLRFARVSMTVARGCMPLRWTKYAHPTYPAAGLFAALLLRERLRLTYRGLEDLLGLSGRLRRLFGLRRLARKPWSLACSVNRADG